MGNCLATTNNTQRHQQQPHHVRRERQWSDRGVPANNRSVVIQSMVSKSFLSVQFVCAYHMYNICAKTNTYSLLLWQARVGSRVFKQSSYEEDVNAAGVITQNRNRGTLAELKASTYEHVHEIVNTGIVNDSSHNGTKNKSGKVGLINVGNTCFMASSLQCLSNTIPLTDYMIGYDYRSEINHDNILGTQGQLVSSYAELIKNLWLGSNSSYKPSTFKSKLSKFAPLKFEMTGI